MNFYFSKTFTDSLDKLDKQWQSVAKQSAFEFQMNPTHPSFQFHRVESAVDNFWSARVNRDIRFIIFKEADTYLLSYVAHHDAAYEWAERRQYKPHPVTGAAQFVEVIERVEEVVRTVVKEVEPPIFAAFDETYLLALGVPEEWLPALATIGESAFFKIVDQLPEEAAERLFSLAAGVPVPVPLNQPSGNPLEHPDAKRRFRRVVDNDELQAALDAPWERWIVFLHPDQRDFVERAFNGPAYVSGSAGTGKTVVALHRAAGLARGSEDVRVLLTTFSRTLAARLGQHLDILLSSEPAVRQRIATENLHRLAFSEYARRWGAPKIAATHQVRKALAEARRATSSEFETDFLEAEWSEVVDAHGVTDWNVYKSLSRTGRGTPLGRRQRLGVWKVIAHARDVLDRLGMLSWNQMLFRVADTLSAHPPLFDHVIVDEAQDFGRPELALVKALAPLKQPNSLFFAGDSGQRIYKRSFSWRSAGIEVVGRARKLKINYRTTEQIRRFADSVFPNVLLEHGDLDGSRDAVSVLSGPTPTVEHCATPTEECETLSAWITNQLDDGYAAEDLAIFSRNVSTVEGWVREVVDGTGAGWQYLSDDDAIESGRVSLGTMHRAKGLEFKSVAVVGCSAEELPQRAALAKLRDPADKAAFIEQERSLFYVACTRARDRLLVTYTGRPTPFLDG